MRPRHKAAEIIGIELLDHRFFVGFNEAAA